MKSRRAAREAALQALYKCDALDDWSDETIALYFSTYQRSETSSPEEDECKDFSRKLIEGVRTYREFIDSQISGASTHWSLPRMSRVDRNLLRLATFEIGLLPDVPVNVSINEAIEIAKRYGTDDSPTFINGVLDHVAGEFNRHPDLVEKAEERRRKRVA